METEIKKYKIKDVLYDIQSDKVILPAFQRDFVWTQQQVIKLFDSIMRGYPISTFLFWNMDNDSFKNNSYFYKFLKSVVFNFSGKTGLSADTQRFASSFNENIVVLDGQQRLTSLYIALMGQTRKKPKKGKNINKYDPIELYLDLSSGSDFFDDEAVAEDNDENEDNNEKNYKDKDSHTYTFNFEFSKSNSDKKKWFKVKDIFKISDILGLEDDVRETRINQFLSELGIDSKIWEKAKENLNLMVERIFKEDVINVLELRQCGLNEASEIFVRFNSGGTKLSKADLVFSTIHSRWPGAKEKVNNFLDELNERNYEFGKDFIVRLALVLFGKPTDITGTDINDGIVDNLRKNWDNITLAIRKSIDFLSNECGITSKREVTSFISIIPIIFSVYNNDCQVKNKNEIKKYIYRSLILNIFSSYTNQRLVDLRKIIMNCDNLIEMEYIEDKIVDFKIGQEKFEQILEYEKSPTTQLILFLIGNNNVSYSRDGSEYHQDHIHASALFDDENRKPDNITANDWNRWGKIKDKLPNLRLLKAKPNKSKSKSKKTLTDWLDAEEETEKEFRKELDLPDDLSLKLKDFEIFYNFRKDLLREKLKKMLL